MKLIFHISPTCQFMVKPEAQLMTEYKHFCPLFIMESKQPLPISAAKVMSFSLLGPFSSLLILTGRKKCEFSVKRWMRLFT